MKQKLPILIILLAIAACNKPEEAEPIDSCQPTYETDIKAIVNSKCAISGCHDGSNSLPALNNYQTLKSRADNGRLQSHVIEKKIMPPASATPLSDSELEIFKCWLKNGAPES